MKDFSYFELSKDIKPDDRIKTIVSLFVRDNFYDEGYIKDEDEFERICSIVYDVYIDMDDVKLESIIEAIWDTMGCYKDTKHVDYGLIVGTLEEGYY